MHNQISIGLYSYSSHKPTAENFKQFYALAISIFKSIGIVPTYVGFNGKGYTGKSTKFNGATHQKALKSDFENIHSVGLHANPVDSDAPAYDSYASLDLSYNVPFNETLLVFAIEERFLQLGSVKFEEIFTLFIALRDWDFGYALSYANKRNPQFHVLGLDDGKLAEDEYRSLCTWYASSPEERVMKIRDVYPYNVLNDKQLNSKLTDGSTLKSIILESNSSTLEPVKGNKLWLWKTQPEALSTISERLRVINGLIG